jgi:hypothetical protein
MGDLVRCRRNLIKSVCHLELVKPEIPLQFWMFTQDIRHGELSGYMYESFPDAQGQPASIPPT